MIMKISFLEFITGILLRPLSAGVLLLACLWPLRHAAWGWRGLLGLSAGSAALYYGVGYYLLRAEEKETLHFLVREVIGKKLGLSR